MVDTKGVKALPYEVSSINLQSPVVGNPYVVYSDGRESSCYFLRVAFPLQDPGESVSSYKKRILAVKGYYPPETIEHAKKYGSLLNTNIISTLIDYEQGAVKFNESGHDFHLLLSNIKGF